MQSLEFEDVYNFHDSTEISNHVAIFLVHMTLKNALCHKNLIAKMRITCIHSPKFTYHLL